MIVSLGICLLFAYLLNFVEARIRLKDNTLGNVTVGEPFTIYWEEAQGSVTIFLMKGPPAELEPVYRIICKFTLLSVLQISRL